MYETIRDFADRKMMNSEALGTVPGAAVGAEDFGELSRAGLSPSANVKVEAKEGDSPQPRGQSQTGPEAAEALRLRHAKHYVECAEALQSRISTHDGLNALNRIELEYDNLFAVQDGLEHKTPKSQPARFWRQPRSCAYVVRGSPASTDWNARYRRLG
jgi:hypothetical protein